MRRAHCPGPRARGLISASLMERQRFTMRKGTAPRRARGESGSVKILEKTVRLLAMFASDRPEWGLTELARAAGLAKSTTYRVLRVLARHDYLTQDGATARFRLGPALMDLGRRAQEGMDLRRIAVPILARLGEESGETVVLMVPNEARSRAICVEQVASRHGLRLIREVGGEIPLHAGATAKALLAYMSREEIARVLAAGLPRVAPRTITSPRRLRLELGAIRARGYAYSAEETNEGAAGVAVPVLDADGGLHAAVGIAGPLLRFPKRQVSRFVDMARRAAAGIAASAGLAGTRRGAGGDGARREGRMRRSAEGARA